MASNGEGSADGLTRGALPRELLTQDFYGLLGVSKTANDEELKKAYRKMALKFHPDRHGNSDEAKEIFQRVKLAYDTLTDGNRRAIYDQYGERGLTVVSSAGPLAEFLSPELVGMINIVVVVATLFLLTLLLFPIFLCLQVDGQIAWNWAVIAIPIWIFDILAFLLIAGAPTKGEHLEDGEEDPLHQGLSQRDREKARQQAARWSKYANLAELSLLVLFQVFVVLRLNGQVGWSWAIVFVPYWVLEGIGALANFRNIAGAWRYGVPVMDLPEDPNDFDPEHGPKMHLRPLRGWERLWTAYSEFHRWLPRVIFSVLLVLKVDGVLQASWAAVFVPVYLWAALELLEQIVGTVVSAPPGAGFGAICAGLVVTFLAFSVFGILYYALVANLVRRLDGADISLAVVLIPIFIVMGLLLCVFSILLPCMFFAARREAAKEMEKQTAPEPAQAPHSAAEGDRPVEDLSSRRGAMEERIAPGAIPGRS